MICVQTQTSRNPLQLDTMTGFAPQKNSRSKATDRYIVIFIFVLFLFYSRHHVVRKHCTPSSDGTTTSRPPRLFAGLPPKTGLSHSHGFPQDFFLVLITMEPFKDMTCTSRDSVQTNNYTSWHQIARGEYCPTSNRGPREIFRRCLGFFITRGDSTFMLFQSGFFQGALR